MYETLLLMLVLLLPANIHVAVDNIPLAGQAATPLWFRIPEQLVYIGVALFAALGSASTIRSAPRTVPLTTGAPE
ncbi:hypothetical protein ACQP1O_30115 [Nocardia sp. CA-151230]|uniref:hypothetical protein n=1 Tax=Nocardia sp. CA-151230 TaxID=3239982 RepID=UPI003D91EF6E